MRLGGRSRLPSVARFTLDELRYEYPEETAPPGMTLLEHLKRLTWEGANGRWPGGVPAKVIELLRHEIQIIEELHYEAYFLTVWDMVRFARRAEHLVPGSRQCRQFSGLLLPWHHQR